MTSVLPMVTKEHMPGDSLSLNETGNIARECLLRFFEESNFHVGFNVRPDPAVQQQMVETIAEWGITVAPDKRSKCLTVLNLGAMAFHATPPDVQVAIGLFAFCAVLFDDGEVPIEEMRSFVPNFYGGVSQTHPVLVRLLETTLAIRKHSAPLMSNMAISCVMEYVNTEVFLRDGGISVVERLQPESVDFVEMLRAKDGFPEIFVAVIWPAQLFPEVQNYIQAVPEVFKFMNWINDLFSWYKEETEGDTRNYVSNYARARGQSSTAALMEVTDNLLTSIRRIRAILGEGNRERDAWEAFASGYVQWHTQTVRYGVRKLIPEYVEL